MSEALLDQYGWLLFTAGTSINAIVLRSRAREQVREHPELARGYRQLILGYVVLGSLPWVVIGAGVVLGGVPGVYSYFRPRDGDPLVLGWHGLVVAYWLLGFYWLFARRGAEFLIAHPGLLSRSVTSPNTIRLLYCVMVAGGIAGLSFMWFIDIPESGR